MKPATQAAHQKVVNDALYYIYRYIDTDINIDALCRDLGVSRFHFQRVFKAQTGENLYERIKSIRLQKAASLLLTNPTATVSAIALACGYASQSSFIRAFKARYRMTPTLWREGGYERFARDNLMASARTAASRADFSHLEVRIVKQPDIRAYYIRHRGYTPQVKTVWQRLQAYMFANDIEGCQTVGLYHDNPVITPLDACAYVAALIALEQETLDVSLPSFVIPTGLYAAFKAEGTYGDILRLIEWAYHTWLPDSGYEATTLPSYTLFEKNHFLSDDGYFETTFYLPIRMRYKNNYFDVST